MSLPRNDSASIISSLQMDYGDSDEEENDSRNNSLTNTIDPAPPFSDIDMKPAPTNDSLPKDKSKADEVNEPGDSTDVKTENVKRSEATVSPVDFISDDEEDNQKDQEQSQHHHPHHHRHHHHHHRHRGDKAKEEEQGNREVLSEALNTDSPASQGSVKLGKKATSLVSYGRDEDVGSEDESEEEEEVEEDSDEGSPVLNASDASILSRSVQNMSKDDIKIPPEPTGKCPYPLQRKIEMEYQRMVREGVDHNRIMQEKKNFRNPSIYEKLIDFCHIDENGTNFPPEIYNPQLWGKESVYDELDKAQRKDMERRDKDKKDRTKIEFLMGTKKPINQMAESMSGPDEKKRKTKWDAQPGGNIQVQYTKLPSAQQNPGVVNLTATATGTKGKVISSVGSLSKKGSK